MTLLVPTTELAAALSNAADRMHMKAGHAVWPTPQIRDFSGWLHERHALRHMSDASLPRALTDFEERELWRAVILESESGKDCLEPNGAALSARRARRAMVEYGIPLRALTIYPTDESLALAGWNAQFEARCRELGCLPADQLLGGAVADGGRIAWIESPIWRPLARRWLEAHGGSPLLPPRGAATARLEQIQAGGADAELAAIAHWAARQLDADPDFRAWICIPDLPARRAELEDAFDAALAGRRFMLDAGETAAPYAVAGGTPLADYPPVRAALSSLAATMGVIPFEDFSRLLRMPELHESISHETAAARLDLELRTRAPSEASLRDWLNLCERLAHEHPALTCEATGRLHRFVELLDAGEGPRPISHWVSVWLRAFEAAPWVWRRRWSSTEFQSVERFRDVLVSLAGGDRFFGARSAAAAARLLQRAARDAAFQAQTGVPGIWVSGQIMDPWLDYDGVWIAGCDADRWPPPVDPLPLLPIRLQREFGVVAASATLQFELALDLEQRWRKCAAQCVFSCATPVDGSAVTMSPLLSAVPPAGFTTALNRPHWHDFTRRAPLLEVMADEQAPPFAADEKTRGVATLAAQSRCAFRGFAETRLACESLERPTPGFNARERGTLLHQVLEDVWTMLAGQAELAGLPPANRAALVSRCVARAIARQCTRRDPGPQWRRREIPRLTTLIDKWLDVELLRAPFEVEAVEQGTQVAHFGGVEFKVRVDRRDRLLDGGRVLIDYKTGTPIADWRGERPDNPQLPIYALLQPAELIAVAYGRVNAGECGFVAEAARAGIFNPRGRPSSLEGMPDFASLIGLWRMRIEALAERFAAGDAAVAPTARACATCGLQALCRIPAALDATVAVDE